MQAMTVRGSHAVRYLTAAAAITIVVLGLKYSSDFLASILFAATFDILFTPALWWPEKKGLPKWLFACHEECPKNHFLKTPDGEPGLNYLCAG